jgi:hypothetical protein
VIKRSKSVANDKKRLNLGGFDLNQGIPVLAILEQSSDRAPNPEKA